MTMQKKRHITESTAGGHKDVAYGVFDRPGMRGSNEDLPDYEPIVPKDQVSTQLSSDRPPVEDPDYVPTSRRSLELALATIASSVPDQDIQSFYRIVRDKVEELVDDELMKNNSVAGEEVMESKIRKMLEEAFSDKDLTQMEQDFEEEFGDEDDEAERSQIPDESSLEQIASKTGFSGPSGVKNFLYRLLSRMARFSDIPRDEIDALVDFAAGEYVDVLHQADLIDDEDAALMSANKSMVSDLPSFKFFIGNAIAAPALKAMERAGKKRADVYLKKLSISDSVKNTLMNQLTGQVPRNDDLISKKLDLEATSGRITQPQADDAKKKITAGFEAMKKLVMSGDDFVEVALRRYSKMPKSKLLDIIRKASEDPFVAEG